MILPIQSKKAALEMSVGTIVTIVLMVSMLVLGLVLIRTIFTGGIDLAKMTEEQLRKQISEIFSEENKIIIFPTSERVEIKQDSLNGVAVGIRNLRTGVATADRFSYEVVVSDPDLRRKCGVSETEALRWIQVGRAEDNIEIAPGDFTTSKILFRVPVGTTLCVVNYRVNVKVGDQAYATAQFVIDIKPK